MNISRCERCVALVRAIPDANSRQKAHGAYLEEARGGWSVSVPNVLGYCLVAALSMMITACGGGGGGGPGSSRSSSSSSSSSSGGPPSPNGSTIVPPATNTINDGSGNVWSVSGGQIYQDGIVLSGSANVIMLLYFNNVIYQQNVACGVWEYTNGGWNPTVLPFSGTLYSQQPTYNTDPVIPGAVLNQCPAMGGIWTAIGGQGSINSMISTATGEVFAVNENDSYGCHELSYSNNIVNVNNVLSGSGVAAAQFSTFPNLGGGSCTGAATPTAFSGTVSPRISMRGLATAGKGGEYPVNFNYLVNYETIPSLASITGSYQSRLNGDVMTLASDGTLNLQDSVTGCTFNGKVSILDQFHSVYRVNVTATGCTGPTTWNGAPEQGIITFFASTSVSGTSSVFGGTSFTDSSGVPTLNVFQ